MIIIFAILVLYFTGSIEVNSENILYLNAVASPSHLIWNREIINALAARGHNVTVLAPDIDQSPPHRVTYLALREVYDEEYEEFRKGILRRRDQLITLFDPIFNFHAYLSECEGIF